MQIILQKVKFKNDFLEIVKIAGTGAVAKLNHQYWVSVKRVCQNLGLKFDTQHKKLKLDPTYEAQLIEVPTNGGVQKVFCIPLSKLNGWLFSINPNRVKPEVREKLIAYKKECFDVLYSYFVAKSKQAVQSNLLGNLDDRTITELIKRTDIVRGYQGTIKRLENELAKKQSEIKNLELKNKVIAEGAKDYIIEKIEKAQKELDDVKALFTKPVREDKNFVYVGNAILPKNNRF